MGEGGVWVVEEGDLGIKSFAFMEEREEWTSNPS